MLKWIPLSLVIRSSYSKRNFRKKLLYFWLLYLKKSIDWQEETCTFPFLGNKFMKKSFSFLAAKALAVFLILQVQEVVMRTGVDLLNLKQNYELQVLWVQVFAASIASVYETGRQFLFKILPLFGKLVLFFLVAIWVHQLKLAGREVLTCNTRVPLVVLSYVSFVAWY